MNKKGFTLVEVLAVIVIIGILSSIAIISLSRYREDVAKKELINLRSTINDSYDSYREDALINYETPENKVSFGDNNNGKIYTYFEDLSYNGERLTLKNIKQSIFELKTKGELLSNDRYIAEKGIPSENNGNHIKDGTCVIKSEAGNQYEEDGDELQEFNESCVKDESGNIKPALEEILCIKLVIDGKTLIDDFTDENNLCHYFGEPANE